MEITTEKLKKGMRITYLIPNSVVKTMKEQKLLMMIPEIIVASIILRITDKKKSTLEGIRDG